MDRRIWILLTVLYMALLGYFSIRPESHGQPGLTMRKVMHNAAHIPAYAVLMFCWLNTLQTRVQQDIRYWPAAAISFSYGVLNEIIQSFVPTRTASLLDVGLNSAGVLLVWWMVRKRGLGWPGFVGGGPG